LQPRREYIDYQTDELIYKSEFGKKYFVPAEMDILVDFAPIRNSPSNNVGQSMSGKLRLRSWYQSSLGKSDFEDPSAVIHLREGESMPKVNIPAQTSMSKTNWDGELVPQGQWVDKELLGHIESFSTYQHAAIGSSILVGIVLLALSLCCLFLYW